MVAITRIDGWSVATDGDEPRILDVELGARLGFARPRDVRKLIERLIKDGKLKDIRISATVARIELRPGIYREQVVDEYWLTERQALKVIAKSETAIADQILDEVIGVFIAVRRGMLPAPRQVAVPVPPNTPTLGALYRDDIRSRCAVTAKCTGYSVHAVQGWLRMLYDASGVYKINAAHHASVLRLLDRWALGELSPPARRRGRPRLKLVADASQGVLPFPGGVR